MLYTRLYSTIPDILDEDKEKEQREDRETREASPPLECEGKQH